MENEVKREITQRLLMLFDSVTAKNNDQDLVGTFYQKSLQSLVSSKTKEELDQTLSKLMQSVKMGNFGVDDFEFNNIILGRLKNCYMSVPYEEQYKGFYYRIVNLSDIFGGLRAQQINFDEPDKLFYKHVAKCSEFFAQYSGIHIKNNLVGNFDNNAAIEFDVPKINLLDSFIRQLFLNFLVANRDFPQLIRDFIVDMLSLELFFINVKIFNFNDFDLLNYFMKDIIESCAAEKPRDKILDSINYHMMKAELIVQLSKLICHILYIILLNSSKYLLQKIIKERIDETLQQTYINSLDTLKTDLELLLAYKAEDSINYKFYALLHGLFSYVFNVHNSELLVFDANRFNKHKSLLCGNANHIIIVNESANCKPTMIFDSETSELLLKTFMRYSFNDFKEEENENFSGWLTRFC